MMQTEKNKQLDPTILLCPNIPKPLHGIAPRVIAGQGWWDIHRKEAYKNANYHCQACGAGQGERKIKPWLEAHEVYDYDYEEGTLTFSHLVALCHCCHNIIHSGRLMMLAEQGTMPQKNVDIILDHGEKVLKANGLLNRYQNRHNVRCSVPWQDWRMVFEGREYGPSSKSMEEWQAGVWRDWTPPAQTSEDQGELIF